jgi:hypothetical protein
VLFALLKTTNHILKLIMKSTNCCLWSYELIGNNTNTASEMSPYVEAENPGRNLEENSASRF